MPGVFLSQLKIIMFLLSPMCDRILDEFLLLISIYCLVIIFKDPSYFIRVLGTSLDSIGAASLLHADPVLQPLLKGVCWGLFGPPSEANQTLALRMPTLDL